MPYFDNGVLVFFSMVRAHWIDIGGMSTGFGGGPRVPDPWMEGLQLNQLKIYRAGTLDETLQRVISDNIRFPESSMGDLRSQIAACRLATRRLDELFGKYGGPTLDAALERIFDETEEKCRNVVSQIGDGTYEAGSFLDHDILVKDERIRLHARVTVDGGKMTIDLSGCAGERRSAINSRTLAGARVAYKALTAPLEPVNEGSFRALDVIIPEGNIMMARYPAPMAGWSLILPTVVDTIIAALAPAMRATAPAAHHGLLGGAVVFFGQHPDTGKSFVIQSIEGGGWGGRPGEDGESGTVSVCQGDVRNATIEAIELKCPVLIEERALRVDSGGAGKHRGGLAIELRVRNFVEGRWNLPGTLRNVCPPWGLWGGKAGGTAAFMLKLPDEDDFKVMDVHRHLVPVESVTIVRTGGGGGWGDPLERDTGAVRWDVVEGFVSRDEARAAYGVVLDPDDASVDHAATDALRADRRAIGAPDIEQGPFLEPSVPAG